MSGPRVYFVLRNDGPSQTGITNEEDVPEPALRMKSCQIPRFEMDEKYIIRPVKKDW
jgi:hypothetical protein